MLPFGRDARPVARGPAVPLLADGEAAAIVEAYRESGILRLVLTQDDADLLSDSSGVSAGLVRRRPFCRMPPAAPMERMLPALPMDRMLPALPMDSRLPELPIDRMLPKLPVPADDAKAAPPTRGRTFPPRPPRRGPTVPAQLTGTLPAQLTHTVPLQPRDEAQAQPRRAQGRRAILRTQATWSHAPIMAR